MATLELTETKTVNATVLTVVAGVRYWEDAEVNGTADDEGTLIPFRSGENWCPSINIDTGQIIGWPVGTTASIHYKVCDEGTYSLLGEHGEKLVTKEGYVPTCMSPGGSGYGDYIIMTVGGDGKIANWRADLSDFAEDD